MADYNLSNFRNYTIFTDQTGSAIYDTGGPTGSYATGENFYFEIAPSYSTGSLVITVESASLNTTDKIRIYNGVPTTGTTSSFNYTGNTTNSQLIAVISGSSGTARAFTASSGVAYVRFSGDTNGTAGAAAGFKLSWTGSEFYNVNSSSGVIYNQYGVTFPTDGTSGSYMTFNRGMLSSSSTVTANKDIIIGFWAKQDLLPASAPEGPVLGIGTSNGGTGITVSRQSSPSPTDSNFRIFYYDNSGSVSTLSLRSLDMVNGGQLNLYSYPPQWNHYGFVIRKTGANTGQYLAYKDGVLYNSSSITKATNWGFVTSSNDIVLGSSRDFTTGLILSGGVSKANWSGSLDDIFFAVANSGSVPSEYSTFFSRMYNSGNWADPNSVITGAISASLNPIVVFNWRFEETGSLLNTKDYGYYGNYHSASATGNIANSSVRLTFTSSGTSYTPYASLAYSASALSNAVISFTSSSASIYENTGSYIFGIQILTASVGQSATASITTGSMGATAFLGNDFILSTNGTVFSSSAQLPIYLSWSAGDTTSRYITASISDNTTYTGVSSSFGLIISTGSSTNITANSPTVSILNILDYEEGYPSFTSASYSFGELSAGTASIYVSRISGSNGPLSVSYGTINNTALSGTNYVNTTGTLSWADTVTSSQLISVPFIYDGLYTGDLSFKINLFNLSTGSFSSYPSAITSSTVTIVDQEPGTFNWEVTSISAYETASSATVNVVRTSGSYGAVTASLFYSSSQGTVNPKTGSAGNVYFSASQTIAQQIFPLSADDLIDEPDDPIYVTFSSFTVDGGTAKTGSSGILTLTIIDNETGSVTFSSSSASIFENTSSYYLGVQRLYGGDQAETASITFVGSTYAISGSDYNIIYNGVTQSSPFNITWADQDKTTKYITASIINDNVLESDETITFGIVSSSISSIGPSSSFVLTIYDYEITGSARFVTSSYSVSIPGSVTVQVERYNGADVSASAIIDVSSSSTAVAGVDYTNIFPYTVNWANQESGSKNIVISTLSSWGPSSILNLKFTSLTNLASGSILTSSVAITSTTITQSSSPYQNINRDYVINDYANLSYQFTRRAQQVPFALNKKGTGLIRKP